jgi:hypothetical protein
MSRTIWVPDFGGSESPYQRLEIPKPGEPGYVSPADRIAAAHPGDPLPAIIAREQAIEEELDQAHAEAEHRADEAELAEVGTWHSTVSPRVLELLAPRPADTGHLATASAMTPDVFHAGPQPEAEL